MKEEILEYFKDINFAYNDCTRFDTLKRMLDGLEQEPCEDANANQHNSNALNDVGQRTNALEGDLISRQAVQDYIAKYLSQYLYNDVREAVEVIDEYIAELPLVNPQEPKYCDRNICIKNEYNGIGCDECEVKE